jgi:ribosomal protein S18 acetylase RimI-like enzyme
MGIRALTADDVDTYKAVRLRALRTDPDAFGSNVDRESAFDDATWRSRLSGFQDRPGCIFVDAVDADPCTARGVIGIAQPSDRDAMIWGMWVAPEHRRSGAATRLVDAAVAWATERSSSTVTLWVVRTNTAAIKLYERHGFVVHDGGGAPDDCTDELGMRLDLTRP